MYRLRLLFVTSVCVVLLVGSSLLSLTTLPVHAASAPALHVSGSTLVDANNNVVRLHGVNESGAEYSCVHGVGTVWDGPTPGTTMLNSLLASHVNSVRIPLNEDCWLGINGASPSGATYQSAIESWVTQLEGGGITPILDLHWSAPGTTLAAGQQPMMDADHSGAFWQSVAAVYKNDQGVLFDVYNEPHVTTYSCWKNGRTSCTGSDASFTVLGMQEAVNDIRGAGANNVLLLGCNNYANVCSDGTGNWQGSVPTDTAHNLVASVHVYGGNACATSSCWTSEYAPILSAGYPVLNGEFCDCNFDGSGGGNTTFASGLMDWLDQNHASGYTAWAWDAWGNTFALICATDGTCLTTYGQYLQSQYATRFSNLIQNPSFETGALSPWTTKITGTAAGSGSIDSTTAEDGTKSAKLVVTTTSVNWWDAAFYQNSIPIVANHLYTISFWVKSDANRTVYYALQANTSPHTVYSQHNAIPVTTTWSKISYTFTPTVNATTELYIANALATGNLWVDNVSLS